MNFKYILFVIASFLILGRVSHAQNRILIDEDFADWQQINPIFTDGVGDGSDIDFKQLWISSDAEYIFLRIALDREINLQEANTIRLHLDTDDDILTGLGVGGIGADLSYFFGDRSGMFGFGTRQPISHADIGLVTSPTVSSHEFEIAIRRDAVLFGQVVFPGTSIKVYLEDFRTGGDMIPDLSGGLTYSLDQTSPGNLPLYSVEKTDPAHLRILSYNVLSDGPWEGAGPPFDRIIRSLNPDIIGFQEIYQHTSQQTSDRVETILQNEYTGPWYHAQMGSDIIAVSKYPIVGSYPILNNGAFLIDLGDREMLFIVAHTPCCGNNQGRQNEIDAMMAFVRDAKAGVGALALAENSPIVIVGDMNLVGFNEQQTTLLTGTIKNNIGFGPDFLPDWDETELEDAKPPTTGIPMTFTWYSPNSSFSPGRLDYIVYSGSVMELKNSFSLFTPALSNSVLVQYGLQQDDAITASDHLPIVGDFQLLNTTAIAPEKESFVSMAWFPNPAQDQATLRYELKNRGFVKIELLDATGRAVRILENKAKPAGIYFVGVSLKGVASGVYQCRLQAGKYFSNKKIMVIPQ